jgi:hypothetical protein
MQKLFCKQGLGCAGSDFFWCPLAFYLLRWGENEVILECRHRNRNEANSKGNGCD